MEPLQARRSRADWESIVLTASSGGWAYLADVLRGLGVTSCAEYQAAWRAAMRLGEEGRIATCLHRSGRRKLLIGPTWAPPPVTRTPRKH